MANQHFILEVLTEAKKQNLLTGKQNPMLIDTVNHANQMLSAIEKAGSEGISTLEIAALVKFDNNTCRIYLRTLEKLKMINSFTIHGQLKYWTINRINNK